MTKKIWDLVEQARNEAVSFWKSDIHTSAFRRLGEQNLLKFLYADFCINVECTLWPPRRAKRGARRRRRRNTLTSSEKERKPHVVRDISKRFHKERQSHLRPKGLPQCDSSCFARAVEFLVRQHWPANTTLPNDSLLP